MRPLILLTLAAALLAETGVRPRAAATEYAAHQSGGGATIAATILTPAEAKKRFGLDLQKLGYTAVEIAVYPDRDVEVAARDFLLRVAGEGRTVRPVAPRAIGPKENRKPPKIPERVQVYGGQRVGYGTGPYGRGGVYTDTTVGVGIGDRPASPPPQNPGTDTASLEADALPEGRFDKPVAGYLYFPVTLKKSAVDLTWYGSDAPVRLAMPRTK
jgi:hypothetical protein